MPVAQPITGVKITETLTMGSVVVHNQRLGIMWATAGSFSALGNLVAYARGTVVNTGNLTWEAESYTPPNGNNACLPFGTAQAIVVPSIWSL